jgi:hypothetical protein
MRDVRCWITALAAGLLWVTAGAGQPRMPKPGPEHEMLKEMEGTWDAVIEAGGQESKGTMVYKMGLGGFWLLSHFDGDLGGMKFQGRGMDGYDPAKKKFVGIWADSMSPTPIVSEGSYDKEKATMTMSGEGPGPEGKPTKYKMVTQMKDKDNMVFTLSDAGKEGKEEVMMTITYKRKK